MREEVASSTNESNEEKTTDFVPGREEFIYAINESPSWPVTILVGIQHCFLCLSIVVPIALMMIDSLCVDASPGGNLDKAKILGTIFIIAGVSTFLQITFGVRLPIVQGISTAFIIPIITMAKGETWKCPERIYNLTEENITGSPRDLEIYYYIDTNGEIANSHEVWQRRMREVQGSVMVVSALQIIIGATGILKYIMRITGPLTIAAALALVGYSLVDIGVKYSSAHWGISICCISIITACQYLSKVHVPLPTISLKRKKFKIARLRIFAMFPFIIALLFSWLLSYILTITGALPNDKTLPAYQARTDAKPDVMKNSPWLQYIYPLQWGTPTCSIGTILAMLTALLLGIIDSICDYYVSAKIIYEPAIPQHAINRGIAIEGIGILLAGLFGTGNASSSYCMSAIAVGITRIASRRAIQAASFFFVIVGFFCKFCSIFVLVPAPIIGGIMCTIGGMAFSVSASNLSYADMSNSRNMFVYGVSMFMGITLQTWFSENGSTIDVGSPRVNDALRSVLTSGMLIASVLALFLDNTMPGSRELRGITKWREGELGSDNQLETNSETYEPSFYRNISWAKWIPLFPRPKPTEDDTENNIGEKLD